MRQRFLFIIVLAALTACAPTDERATQGPSKENLLLRDQIAPNWNVPTPLQCRRVVSLRVRIAPDGTVTGTEPVEPIADGDPCRTILESLRRAVLISSPLWFPEGETPDSAVIRFDPEDFKDWY